MEFFKAVKTGDIQKTKYMLVCYPELKNTSDNVIFK